MVSKLSKMNTAVPDIPTRPSGQDAMDAWTRGEISLMALFEKLDDVKDWMSIAVIFACVPNAKMVCRTHAIRAGNTFVWNYLQIEPDLFEKSYTYETDASGKIVDIVTLPPFRSIPTFYY